MKTKSAQQLRFLESTTGPTVLAEAPADTDLDLQEWNAFMDFVDAGVRLIQIQRKLGRIPKRNQYAAELMLDGECKYGHRVWVTSGKTFDKGADSFGMSEFVLEASDLEGEINELQNITERG